jgi:predicted house-cleaning noncanonical NTP pyrophosphatase (MazG superfamily)
LLQEKYGEEYYVTKLTVVDKLIVLMGFSKQIILVRDREEKERRRNV